LVYKGIQTVFRFFWTCKTKRVLDVYVIPLFIYIHCNLFSVFLTSDIYEDTETNWVYVTIICSYLLLSIIPSVALTIRRLHDTGKSGWWYLIVIIPYIGWFTIMIFACMEGNRGTNKWGPNPKGIGNDSIIDQIGKE